MAQLQFPVFLALTLTTVVYGCDDSETWTHKTFLDDDTYRVFMQWKPDNENITIKVIGETKGWLAIGFSPNGTMDDSDIALGWVKNGKGYLQDRHGVGHENPLIDKNQDLELLSATENETHTTLCFRRKLTTCDQEDNNITGDTMRIIWAMNPEDPEDPDNSSSAKYHGKNNRGEKSEYMLSIVYPEPTVTGDIKTWKVQVHNVSLPNNESTFYWCQFFKPPKLETKHHYIGFKPLHQKENKRLIHHFSLNECTGDTINEEIESIPNWDKGFPCLSPTAPRAAMNCEKGIAIWTAGSEGDFHPPHIGFPFAFNKGKPVIYMLDAHYNNPSLKQNVIDSSALLIYYTSKLRKFDGDILLIGYVMHNPYQLVPPRQEKYLSVSHCAPECLQKTFPDKKFKAYGAVLHSHMTTKKMTLRHFRGNKELPPVAENDHSYYLHQATKMFEEIEIHTTDKLTVECVRDSSTRTNMTIGGVSVQDEMCLSFLFFYPRSTLSICDSHLSREVIENVTGVKLWPQQSPEETATIKEPAELRNQTLLEYLKTVQLNQTQINKLQNLELTSNKTVECRPSDKKNNLKDIKYVNYPEHFTPYIKKEKKCQ